MAKRTFDILVASTVLFWLWPLMLLVAILVKLDSPGPIIFSGRRLGRYGAPFTQYKFRSMRVASTTTDCSVGKYDERITKVGVVIRRLKIDELPQLVNVLRGEMSIVGPRPELLRYAATLTGNFAPILGIRPGLTDIASLKFSQVEEVLGAEDPDRVYEESILPEKNLLRLRYVETRTFWGDAKIVMATIGCLGHIFVRPMLRRGLRRNQ